MRLNRVIQAPFKKVSGSLTRINRHDFGVSWNDVVENGGVVVGSMIDITIDAEAILEGPDEGAHEAAARG